MDMSTLLWVHREGFLFSGTQKDLDGAVQAWYDEKDFYNYGKTESCDKGAVCGHYTQVNIDAFRNINEKHLFYGKTLLYMSFHDTDVH